MRACVRARVHACECVGARLCACMFVFMLLSLVLVSTGQLSANRQKVRGSVAPAMNKFSSERYCFTPDHPCMLTTLVQNSNLRNLSIGSLDLFVAYLTFHFCSLL